MGQGEKMRRDFDLSWDPMKQPFFTHGLDFREFDGVSIDGFRETEAPENRDAFPVSLRSGTRLDTRLPAGSIRLENVRRENK